MLHDSFMIRALLLRLCETNFADDVSSATNDAVSPAQQFFLVFLRVWWRVVWQQRGRGRPIYLLYEITHWRNDEWRVEASFLLHFSTR